MGTAWQILWELFGQVGLPAAILSDNAFGKTSPSPQGNREYPTIAESCACALETISVGSHFGAKLRLL
jgi:hypothetical protein